MTHGAKPPFSRPLDLREVPAEGLRRRVEATGAERAALAAADGLVALKSLVGDFLLRRHGKAGLVATGEVRAEATQTCVVSLDPFDVTVVEPVKVVFAPPEESAAARAAHSAAHAGDDDVALAALSETDPPDPIEDGRIDLGALAAEFLALALDPYPRKPGAALPAELAPPQADSPFAGLGSIARTASKDRNNS